MHSLQTDSSVTADRCDPSPLAQAERILSSLATSPSLQLPLKLYASPFLSQGELGESVLGVRSRDIVMKDLKISTLVLPRLQLKLLASTSLHTVSECRTLLADLKLIN